MMRMIMMVMMIDYLQKSVYKKTNITSETLIVGIYLHAQLQNELNEALYSSDSLIKEY